MLLLKIINSTNYIIVQRYNSHNHKNVLPNKHKRAKENRWEDGRHDERKIINVEDNKMRYFFQISR